MRHLFNPIVDRSGADTGLHSDLDDTGLLQLGTLRRASQQHSEVAACAPTSRNVLFDAPRRLSGTRVLEVPTSVIGSDSLSVFKINIG